VRFALEETPGVKLYTPADPRLSAALTTFSIDGVAPETIVRTLIDDHKVYTRTIVEHDVARARLDALLQHAGRSAQADRGAQPDRLPAGRSLDEERKPAASMNAIEIDPQLIHYRPGLVTAGSTSAPAPKAFCSRRRRLCGTDPTGLYMQETADRF